MLDDYQIPAIALIAALTPAFLYLHLRFRSVRTRLWLLGMACVDLHALLFWRVTNSPNSALPWAYGGGLPPSSPWMSVASETALMFSSALFLASLSPLSFRIGRLRILYVVPYTIPLVLYSFLFYGVARHPEGHLLALYVGLSAWAALVGFVWSLQKGMIPTWLATLIVGLAALFTVPFFLRGDVYWPLIVVQSGNMIMTTLLVIFTFRRFSPGVFLAALGFLGWALPPFFGLGSQPSLGQLGISLVRAMILGKVAIAIGLILLVLEDEIAKNQAARERERRARLELEAYSRPLLTARSLEEFDRDSGKICATIASHSRFGKAVLVVRTPSGEFTVAGAAGMDGATVGALDALVHRIGPQLEEQLSPPDPADRLPSLTPDSNVLDLDLTPWLTPGDDLERLRLTRLGVLPLLSPEKSVEGALFLTGLRNPQDPLRADDLLPVESLAGRLQSARSLALLLGKLIDSERFAGVGQLATRLAQQLNNPLTVILGYAALLEEAASSPSGQQEAEAILAEARRMKNMLERIALISRPTAEVSATYSIPELMADMEQMHRIDFLRFAIDFRLSVTPEVPRNVVGNAHNIRQVLMHLMQFSIESVQHLGANEPREVRLEASVNKGNVRILAGHSGRPFAHPARVFDSLTGGILGADVAGIGLSLSAAIVREHRGRISAINRPNGAAVLVELPVD